MGLDDVKLFGRWDWKNIVVRDPGLQRYICLKPTIVAHEAEGRHAKKHFGKAEVNIVERLINRLMGTGHVKVRKKQGVRNIYEKKHRLTSRSFTGMKITAYKIVKKAFELVHERTGENPLQVLVRAIENASPREETVSVQVGGVIVPVSVDVSPQRRVDLALRFLCNAARAKAFVYRKHIWETLAEEIIYAARNDPERSLAVKKKEEIERAAEASR
ncbi:MAG: 30S ribosomal protein S7 [bacterium]|nr:30S ribosomal protein S7 [bacterium]